MLTAVSRVNRSRRSQNSGSRGLILIGWFKLVKALLLILVGIGAVMHWVNVLRVDPDNRFIHRIIAKAFDVTPAKLKELSVGTFFYAGLLLTEAIGLLLRKHWAEYFTVITTAALLPLEVYELARHLTPAKLLVLAINIAIVVYLIMRLRTSRPVR
jgi:uncharacterized membrane protein (DUF2068 family)